MLKIIHTADWHLGQLFHRFERTEEHQYFLNWLLLELKNREIDVLLISGDVFDHANPSTQSIQLLYRFLQDASAGNPNLQILVIAGNHDSASRLEVPKPLISSKNIHIVGLIPRLTTGEIDYEKLCFSLKNKAGKVEALCLAVPFLRLGDYPKVEGAENSYSAGIKALYQEAYDFAQKQKTGNEAIVAMGHLHVKSAIFDEKDNSERSIIGGVDSIATSDFPAELAYLALGHIHKEQALGRVNFRYSGSPIPLSFSEKTYNHSVTYFELENGLCQNIMQLETALLAKIMSIPEKHKPLQEVLNALEHLPNNGPENKEKPFLEVRVLLTEPEPALRYKIEEALKEKWVRLTTINATTLKAKRGESNQKIEIQTRIEDLNPLDIVKERFAQKYKNDMPKNLISLFEQALQETQKEEER
ncbi:MAG: exonuclease SbcCD subunit D [Luteibaculaceae bacterium]